ncbi:MAG: hypothetical protein U1E35_03245 [Rhodospirillales bacterium]
MRGSRHLCHLAQEFDVRRRLIEVIIADEAAEWLTAEGSILLLIDLLEDRALVPRRPLKRRSVCAAPSGDVEYPDFRELVCLGIVDEIAVASALARFQLLNRMMVILFSCSPNRLSISAIIASMDLTTSVETSLVLTSACPPASAPIAEWRSSPSVCGRNSSAAAFLELVGDGAAFAAAPWAWVSPPAPPPSPLLLRRGLCRRLIRLAGGGQRLQQGTDPLPHGRGDPRRRSCRPCS